MGSQDIRAFVPWSPTYGIIILVHNFTKITAPHPGEARVFFHLFHFVSYVFLVAYEGQQISKGKNRKENCGKLISAFMWTVF